MTLPALRIDYVVPPRRGGWSGYVLLALALAVAAGLVMRYQDVQRETETLKAAKDLLGVERRAPAIPKARLDEQIKNAEAVVRQLALPWAELIQTLERAATKDVAILQLQPDAQQRVLKITAEARSNDAILEYLRRLTAAESLSEVHLVGHQVRGEEPQQPIQFSIQARFRTAQ